VSRRRKDGPDWSLPGVRPLRDRDKLRPKPAPDATAAPEQTPSRPRFVVEESDGLRFARREDVARRRLADLRAGRVPVDREIDLHGLRAREAKRALLDALVRAQRSGARCVLVIHGAGLHSASGAVLKDALPGWLMEGACEGEILAFASAPQALGGAGATLVLLRRPR
jgi:DNA-nicking Smr family endonuclease